MTCEPEIWKGCYSGTFDLLTPESFAHPAKMSPSLCFKIIEHLEELRLIKSGDTILDPMGGTGLTAICANAKGYKAVTVELEEKFIGFQKANKDYAGRKLGKPLDWAIIQGDSRKLSVLLAEHGVVTVTSPPYEEAIQDSTKGGIDWLKCAEGPRPDKFLPTASQGSKPMSYGSAKGNIGNLPAKPLTVVSPPYAESQSGGGIINEGYQPKSDSGKKRWPEGRPPDKMSERTYAPESHGQAAGQIGNLPDKPLTVVSPPYDGNYSNKDRPRQQDIERMQAKGMKVNPESHDSKVMQFVYGETPGQISNEVLVQESYLSAMRLVYAEIAKVSDVCVVVTKNPTRAGALRRLDLDTVALLQEVGYSILCRHKALLFEESQTTDLFGVNHKKVKGRMSFFKRLSYQKGNAVAQWEDVIFAVKNGGGRMVTLSSLPYEGEKGHKGNDLTMIRHDKKLLCEYGNTPGQIGVLR